MPIHTRLNLNRIDLFGWEQKKSIETIEDIIKKIERSHLFSPVPVVWDGNRFYLDPSIEVRKRNTRFKVVDGGHNRAVAHYIANKPLKVRISKLYSPPKINTVLIKDVILISNPSDYKYLSKFPNL